MVHAASARQSGRRPTARRLDKVTELRKELWDLHSLLVSMDPAEPDYQTHAERVLELTEAFLHAVDEQRRSEARRSWRMPRPRPSTEGTVPTKGTVSTKGAGARDIR